MVGVGVVAIFVLGHVGDDWSKAGFYAAGAGVIALGATVGLLWVYMARDCDLRRRRG
jgi:hypothetical protein